MRRGGKTSLGMIAAACAAAVLAACASSAAPALAVAVTRGVAATEPAADPRPFGMADSAFGLDVLRAWCTQYPGQNLVFSPSTLASALGMAYLGAKGPTAAAMAAALHLPTGAGTSLAAGLQARSQALAGLDGPGITVSASNQVWADPGLPPLSGYLNAVATGYDAGVAQAPFAADPAKAAAEINGAIAAQTRGHITNLVTPDALTGIGWMLTSALYLDAKWATPFDKHQTRPQTFTPASGKPVSVPFLNGAGFPYAAAGGWQAVSLPYQGGQLTMTALLPPKSADCALPSQATLTAIDAGLRAPGGSDSAVIALPEVNLKVNTAEGDMSPVLKRLGMGVAFDPQAADFTGLSPQAGPIGFVQQAATLQVGEQGTVGSAAAAVGVEPASASIGVSGHDVVFDRPYLLVVSARSTGEPLFLAEVANPADS